MNWTEQNLREYAQRRLKDEVRARETICNAVAGKQEKVRIPGNPQPASALPKKVAGSGNRHNPQVVIAFFRHHGLPEPVPEYRFDPKRKWRFDWAWPENWAGQSFAFHHALLALEVQGGIWTQGRHVRPAAMLKEFEKLNQAATLGWRILFVTPDQLLTKATVDLVREALAL